MSALKVLWSGLKVLCRDYKVRFFMPVTLNLESREAEANADLGDYVWSSERSEGTQAFWGWLAIIALIVGGLCAPEATRAVGMGVLVWWLLAVFGYFVLAPFLLRRRLSGLGEAHAVHSRRFPRYKAVLTKAATMLGVREPEGFVVDEGALPVLLYGRTPPYFLTISQAAADELEATELDCLLVRLMIHIRQKHSARLMLLQLLSDTPKLARVLVWPVGLYAYLLRLRWHDSAQKTADRLALLLFKNHKLLLAALLKEQIAGDVTLQNSHITNADIDRFVKQEGAIGLQSDEISTQYKLGSAIHQNPILEDRVHALQRWSRAPEYAEAVAKLAVNRAKQSGSATFRAPETTPS